MFEKVNPSHPDKVADRIAGAIVDLAYKQEENPKVACEVLLGHGVCNIILETSKIISYTKIYEAVKRITGEKMDLRVKAMRQDPILACNQEGKIRCGDNGIFRGVPITEEQKTLSDFVRNVYEVVPFDGKYIIDERNGKIIICQSNISTDRFAEIANRAINDLKFVINPLGDWSGGLDVDAGATNRKLGSDMGDAVTGGGLHGKDLSKADVTLNIYAHIEAKRTGKPVELCCAIGDEKVNGIPYHELVEQAREFIRQKGGFEKFAEWGLI